MRAHVRIRGPDGQCVELGHGDLIGRVGTAALVIDDPRVSEAHAIVSQRHGQLMLLSLRRLLAVGGHPMSEVVLEPGLDVQLAAEVAVHVEDVVSPSEVLALAAPGLGVRVLGTVASVHAGPPLRVSARFDPDAAAHLWLTRDAWRLRLGNVTRTVALGDTFALGNDTLSLVQVEADEADGDSTDVSGGVAEPLRLVARYDVVELHRSNRPVVTVGGLGARIVSELAAVNGPADWEVIAREVWSDNPPRGELRDRWDAALRRLRVRLRAEGVRSDLVRADGTGSFALVLYSDDRLEDRT